MANVTQKWNLLILTLFIVKFRVLKYTVGVFATLYFQLLIRFQPIDVVRKLIRIPYLMMYPISVLIISIVRLINIKLG